MDTCRRPGHMGHDTPIDSTQARQAMRTGLFMLATIGGLFAFGPAAEACSIRGTYCGYPSWAANAFDRYGFKGNPHILTDYYPDFSSRKAGAAHQKARKRYR